MFVYVHVSLHACRYVYELVCVCVWGEFVHMLVRKIWCYGESTALAVVKHSPALAGNAVLLLSGPWFPRWEAIELD